MTNDTALPLEVKTAKSPNKNPDKGLFKRILNRAVYIHLFMAVLFLGGIIGMYFQPPGLQKFFELTGLVPGAGTSKPIAIPVRVQEELDKQQIELRPTDVVSLGKLLPANDIITVSPPFGAGDARVVKLLANEGDKVEQGDTIAILDNLSAIESRIASARATVAVREANLQQVKEATNASRDEAVASLERAKSVLLKTKSDMDRTSSLFEKGIVSKASMDNASATYDQARRDVDRAQATLNRFQSEDLNNQADVIVALRNLEAAKADFDQAQSDLSQAYIKAPSSGTIIKTHVRPGEKPGNEGIAEIGDLQSMKAEVEVYQTLIGRVELGQQATLTALALNQPLSGEITKIGLEVGRQTIISDDPAAITDARIVVVTVTLDEQSSRLASRFTNLEVVARINTGSPS